MFYNKKNQGFSLVEILVGQVVIGIILLGSTSLVSSLHQMHSHQNLKFTLFQIQSNIRQMIMNNEAWTRTVSDAANSAFTCLRDGSSCSMVTNADFFIKNGSDSVVYNPIPAGNGFTPKGESCTTFNPVGNDACPLKVLLRWNPRCSDTPCINPQIDVRVTFDWRAASDQLRNLPIRISNYDFTLIRSNLVKLNQHFLVTFEKSDGAAGIGEGTCSTAAWGNRALNRVKINQGGNLLNDNGDGTLTINNLARLRRGTYFCRATAPAYRVGTHKIRLRFSNAVAGPAPPNIEGTGAYTTTNLGFASTTLARVEGRFIVNATSVDLEVQHYCSNSNGTDDLGIAARDAGGNYDRVVYTILHCVRTA